MDIHVQTLAGGVLTILNQLLKQVDDMSGKRRMPIACSHTDACTNVHM